MEFVVEASLLVNEGGVQCTPVVFARPLRSGDRAQLGERAFLNGIASLRSIRSAPPGAGPA